MGNWKQVQSRIRRARTGADAPAKLEQLFSKTRDGMVAFELAKVHEAAQRSGDAIEWYRKAHERFRREEWRRKAVEAIERLGGAPPEAPAGLAPGEAPEHAASSPPEEWMPPAETGRGLPERLYHQTSSGESEEEASEEAVTAAGAPENGTGTMGDAEAAAPEAGTEAAPAGEGAAGGKRRRRGRRGGRRHRKGRGATPQPAAGRRVAEAPHAEEAPPATGPRPRAAAPPVPRTETPAEAGWVGAHAEELRTRAGDPGLASRVARLEMQVRRLLACPPHRVGEAEKAPAGPGVLLLSDSDLTTHYYISACDTLRIEMSRLTRAERGGRGRGRGWEGETALRSRLAEHLEITESQVAKYMETHCVVRWLQLDEGASRVAHFAIGVLEPILNE